jgi:ABC-type transport system substrate-binding protein
LTPVTGWHYPGASPYDDYRHNQFGPMTPNLLITPYESQQDEYLAYKTCDIDFMDCSLMDFQLEELNTIDPNMDTYARAFYADRGMHEFDLNNMKFPTNDVQFRKAMAYCFDKNTFIATQMAGLALKMDSPLAWSSSWYNPYCTDLYPYNLTTAQTILDNNGYTDRDTDGWREGPNGEEIELRFFARGDDPDRHAMAQILAANLESIGVDVDLINTTIQPFWEHEIYVQFNYHIFTGGWFLRRDPTSLYYLYLGDYAQAYPYTPNYVGYNNSQFDMHAHAMMNTTTVGDQEIPCTAKYHVYEMQRILMDDVGIIPVFTHAGYGAYKTGWEKVVNTECVGPWGWFTMLNTHRADDDTIKWGMMKDIDQLNPIHSAWLWDWNILNLVYDSLINVDPYDMSIDKPWMAKNWTMGEWTYQGKSAIYIEFKLREDMYWHNIAPKPDRQTPSGAALLTSGATNEQVTADDVVFSIYAFRDIEYSWFHYEVADVVYAEEIDPYTVRVYYSAYEPLWVLHLVGGIPIVPKHVWEPVVEEGRTNEFDPVAQKCLSGSGPWIYDYDASSLHQYYMLRANTRYFRYHPVDLIGKVNHSKIVQPCDTVNIAFSLHNQDFQRIITPCTMRVIIQIHYPNCTWVTLYNQSNPELPPCVEVPIFGYTLHIDAYGLYEVLGTIEPDLLTGHADQDGYTVYLRSTIPADINWDFTDDIFDIVQCAMAFGAVVGDMNWDPKPDIAPEYGIVDIFDLVAIAVNFGWSL